MSKPNIMVAQSCFKTIHISREMRHMSSITAVGLTDLTWKKSSSVGHITRTMKGQTTSHNVTTLITTISNKLLLSTEMALANSIIFFGHTLWMAKE